ncbi:hypothetical protein [Yinghuangia sp. YIM S09857]|uniref:hypothetical protein n=1 Tax=Yinghuangia sp. YIM S09857 TaxID=3436929 RepID=UPI003F5354C9
MTSNLPRHRERSVDREYVREPPRSHTPLKLAAVVLFVAAGFLFTGGLLVLSARELGDETATQGGALMLGSASCATVAVAIAVAVATHGARRRGH